LDPGYSAVPDAARERQRVLSACPAPEAVAIPVPHLAVPENQVVKRWLDAVRGADRPDGQTAADPRARLYRLASDAGAGKLAVLLRRPVDEPEQYSASLRLRLMEVPDTQDGAPSAE